MEFLLELPHPWADGFIIGVLVVASFFCGFRKSRFCLQLLAFSLVLTAFFISVGTKWGAVELVPVAILIGLFVRMVVARRSSDELRLSWPILALILGLGAFAVLSSWFAPKGFDTSTGLMQRPDVRPFVQAGSYFVVLLFYLIPVWLRVGVKDLVAFIKAFHAAVVIAALYGLYQLFAFRFGLPFRGIQYLSDKVGLAVLKHDGGLLFRMNGLSNEPKQLAAVAVVAAATAVMSKSLYSREIYRIGVIIACVTAFVGAWSTGGMLVMMLVIGAGFAWALRPGQGLIRRGVQVVMSLAVLAGVFVVASGGGRRSIDIVRSVAFERVAIPLVYEFSGPRDRIEHAVLTRLVNNPDDVVTGLGLGNYPYAVGSRGEWVSSGGIQPMHSVILTLLADFGFAGPLVLLGALIACLQRALKLSSQADYWDQRGRVVHGVLVTGLVASFLASVLLNLLPLILLLLGALHSFHRSLNEASIDTHAYAHPKVPVGASQA